MRFLTVLYVFIHCIPIHSNGSLSSGNKRSTDWSFLPQLQQLCPYTSFCGHNATMNFPESSKERSCCEPCSCKAGCEEYGDCCVNYQSDSITERLVKCTSPVVSRTKVPTIKYVMIYSCSDMTNNSMCDVNITDYKSFAPVTAVSTGAVYVNSECAVCNDVHDVIAWELAIKCTQENDHSFDIVRLLQGEDTEETGCHVAYIPPNYNNIESRQCVPDAIRECNVTGRAKQWEPLWEYCPLFNATYTQDGNVFYGNIFCFMCNSRTVIKPTCEGAINKGPRPTPFTAILDFTLLQKVIFSNDMNVARQDCNPKISMEQSLQMGCRQLVCPMGKLRIGNRCGFYSRRWIGGSFTAVLKLTPLGSERIDRTLILVSELRKEEGDNHEENSKSRWLKRNAMSEWNAKTLYRPSPDGKYVDYLLAFMTYPDKTSNPFRLEAALRQTLKETWELIGVNQSIPLHVQFSLQQHYSRLSKSALEFKGIVIDGDTAFIVEHYFVSDNKDKYMLPLYFPGEDFNSENTFFLNEMFLCEQVILYPDEFEITASELRMFDTNETLYEAEYRIIDNGDLSVCVDRFLKSDSSNVVNDLLVVALVLSLICTDIVLMINQ